METLNVFFGQTIVGSLNDEQLADLIKDIPRHPLLAGQFCQAMGLSHELKYQADGGPGLKACFDLVRAYSANPIKDFQQLMQWVFFNYLIGNMDGPAKNLSFMYQAKQIRLALFYDMLCTNIYENLSQKLAMKIGGENREQ